MKLTYKLNGIKCWKQIFDKHNCIYQSCIKINNGILGNSIFLFRILVPEKSIKEFNKEKI
jgi:hypothetical protein